MKAILFEKPTTMNNPLHCCRPFLACLLLLLFLNSRPGHAQVSGVVFKDFNFNGTQQTSGFPVEPFAYGIEVRAYNAANVQLGTTKITSVAGAYSFTSGEVPSGTAVRIEFTDPAGSNDSRAAAGTNGSSIQFATAPSTTVNYAITSTDWYSSGANPYTATNAYTNGDPNGGGTAGANNNLFIFPYDLGNGTPNDGGATRRLVNSQLGSVYGLAYQKTTRTLFMSAYLKRHSGFGPGGIGAIYRTVIAATGVPATATLLADVSSIGINVGTDPRTVALPAASATRNGDANVFAEVGKRGIGGMDISEDGRDLYFVNMYEKKLHRITIGNPVKATITAGDVTGNWVITDPSAAGTVWHPMACKTANGKVYVGGVVVREKTTAHVLATDTVGARGVVYEFDPATAVFTQVLSFAFNYRRGFSNNDYRFPYRNNWWCAWQNNGNGGAGDPLQADYNAGAGAFNGGTYYPQPMLASIEFDVNGELVMGVRDRFSDQMGYQNLSNDNLPTGTGFGGTNNYFRALSSGEILRAGRNTGANSYTLESLGAVTNHGVTTSSAGLDPSTPAVSGSWTAATGSPMGGVFGPGWGGTAAAPAGGPNPGTQGGYFYFNHNFSNTGTPGTINPGAAISSHYMKTNGGLALLAGANEIIHTAMDPVSASYTNGIIKNYNAGAQAGNMSQRLQLTLTTSGTPGDPANFGKAGGIGDVELLTDYQPIEIGNRVWNDANGNGIQDAGETGISGVTVQLTGSGADGIMGTGDDVVLASTTTSAGGEYYFNTLTVADSRKPAAFIGVGANDILPGFDYQVRINPGQAALSAYQLTRGNAAANTVDRIDNDGAVINGFAAFTFNSYFTSHTIDFGFKQLGSIGDRVWRDDNKDGIQTNGEPGVAGITISLFTGTTLVGTTVTDAYGNYLFDNLAAGNYSVIVTLPANYQFTTQTNTVDNTAGTAPIATGSDVNATTGQSYVITLSAGENERNIDAGIIFNTPAATASVGNRVFFDTNNDNLQTAGEPGVSGVTVSLLDNLGNIVATTITDANGFYLFTNVTPGTYSVRFSNPPGTVFVTANQGVNGAGTGTVGESDLDSDAGSNGTTGTFTVSSGQQIVNVDAGIRAHPTTVAALGDRVWYDNNRNGIQDAGEPGIPNVTVTLYRPGAGADGIPGNADDALAVATTTTNGYGNYLFASLTPGNYAVNFAAVAGLVRTTRNVSSGSLPDAIDSDPDATTGNTILITLPAGAKNMSVDAGYYSSSPAANVGALGDRVWNDFNGNGVQDAGEPGVAGILVTLYNNAGTAIATTYTDASGNYLFTNLTPGTYSVGFSNLPAGFSFTGQDLGGNDATDSDVNPATGRTASATVTGGATNTTVDAGIRQGTPGGLASLGNFVWYDLNSNGLQDAGELGVAGVTVTLFNAGVDGIPGNGDDGATLTSTTNSLGQYSFTGLAAGNYAVQFSTLPAGVALSTPNSGSNDNIDSDGLAAGTNGAPAGASRTGIYALAVGEDNLSVDLGLTPPVNTNTLGNFVWHDLNSDGLQTAGEPGIPGVPVTLYNNAGTAIATTTTDAGGAYIFVGLADGTYSVGFSNLPAGYEYSVKDAGGSSALTGSDADRVNGRTGTVVLGAANRNDVTLDAGLISTRAALGNFVWNDYNNDGIQTAGEPGVAGVTVSLYYDADNNGSISGAEVTNPVATAITDASGAYYFPNLLPGNYSVGFTTIPVNMLFTQQNTPGDNQDNTNSDADPATGLSALINLAANEVDLTIDAGLSVRRTATIGNFVWADVDKDGVQDANEPGLGGVVVILYNASNIPIGSAVTDGNGRWQITDVPFGTGYYVIFTANLPAFTTSGSPGVNPAWTTIDIGANGTLAIDGGSESDTDSDVTASGANAGRTATFSVVAGNNFPNIDAGIINWPYSAVLPVKLQNFTAAPQNSNVILNWEVADELNLLKYEVEFSSDASNYASIGSVTATGARNYSLLHTTPVVGMNYYRLKMMDRNGDFKYSDIRRVNFSGGSKDVLVYPTPANRFVNVTLTAPMLNKPLNLTLIATDGKMVKQQRVAAASQTEVIDVSNLANGKYFLTIQSNGAVITKTIVVMH